MAINIPIITSLEDTGIRSAKAAFNDFKTAVGNAEGGVGKFKAGSKVALDIVSKNAALFAVAAGASIGKFVGDGIQAFSDLALSAGKFADATGLAVEDASRYIEAAGDIGIPVDAVEQAIGRLNKTIGADPDKVRDLGVDLVYLRDGSLDVNETFKNTIDRIKGIKDPAEKARVATQLLGKGWQSMAELINMGSVELTASLRSVSEEQIISVDELQKAKDYRDATNDLGDAFTKLKYSAGESLIPLLTKGAEALTVLVDASAQFKREDPLEFANKRLREYFQAARDARADTDLMKEAIKQARNPLKELGDEATNTKVAFVNADTAWKDLTTSLDEEVALDNAKTKLGELEAAAALAFGTGNQQNVDDYEAKLAEFAGVLEGISGTMDGISSKEILFKFKAEGPAAALEYATYLARGAEYGGISQQDALTLAGISTLPQLNFRASGGPVMAGGSYIVGEKGPELFTPNGSGNITPNGGFGGGANITVNVNGGDPNQVVAAIQRWVRDNGAIPMTTTTAIRR